MPVYSAAGDKRVTMADSIKIAVVPALGRLLFVCALTPWPKTFWPRETLVPPDLKQVPEPKQFRLFSK